MTARAFAREFFAPIRALWTAIHDLPAALYRAVTDRAALGAAAFGTAIAFGVWFITYAATHH